MKSVSAALAATLCLTIPGGAQAALSVGAPAPALSAPGVEGGKTVSVTLAALLKEGPVVLFFLPTIFTGSSSAQCRAFAAAIGDFRAAGAKVIGMSREPIEALADFSKDECAAPFPIASADLAVVTGYDVNDSANFATRTTYVIAPGGTIAFVHDDDDPSDHVKRALEFVQGMKR